MGFFSKKKKAKLKAIEECVTGIKIWTDGSCFPNPDGEGGWSFVIRADDLCVVRSGYIPEPCTNNRAELLGAIAALKQLDKNTLLYKPVTLYTDSQYVQKGITQWISGWISRGWRNVQGQPTPNKKLWQLLLDAKSGIKVQFKHVRGHTGEPMNELCDWLANAARENKVGVVYQGCFADLDDSLRDVMDKEGDGTMTTIAPDISEDDVMGKRSNRPKQKPVDWKKANNPFGDKDDDPF